MPGFIFFIIFQLLNFAPTQHLALRTGPRKAVKHLQQRGVLRGTKAENAPNNTTNRSKYQVKLPTRRASYRCKTRILSQQDARLVAVRRASCN